MSRYYVSRFYFAASLRFPVGAFAEFCGIAPPPRNKKTAPIQEAVSKKNLSRYFAAGAAGIFAGAESTSITSTSKMSVELTGIPGTGWLP